MQSLRWGKTHTISSSKSSGSNTWVVVTGRSCVPLSLYRLVYTVHWCRFLTLQQSEGLLTLLSFREAAFNSRVIIRLYIDREDKHPEWDPIWVFLLLNRERFNCLSKLFIISLLAVFNTAIKGWLFCWSVKHLFSWDVGGHSKHYGFCFFVLSIHKISKSFATCYWLVNVNKNITTLITDARVCIFSSLLKWPSVFTVVKIVTPSSQNVKYSVEHE